MEKRLSLVRRFSQIGTFLQAHLRGELVGIDGNGRKYFRLRAQDWAGRESRWVLYEGEPEAGRIPPTWRAWLQHQAPLPQGGAALVWRAASRQRRGRREGRSSWIWAAPASDERQGDAQE